MSHQIDRSSPLPLYYQLKQILLEKIESGLWSPGDLIPSEHELQETYGVSRTTVRQTLSDLVHEGVLVRHRGRGTFVAQSKLVHDPGTGVGFSEYLVQQGVNPQWQLRDRQWIDAPRHVSAILGSEQVYRLRWLFSADTTPIGHHVAYLPAAVVSEDDATQLQDDAWQERLRQTPLTPGYHVKRTLEAMPARSAEIELLGVRADVPVLSIELIVYDTSGTPIELLEACFDGSRFKYQITI
ncbi:MAG: GntR family transcriptional regulator [Anaerolineae bacterium]|nr:GntR family transcriptional regulator [Anaerolineae bacterium]MCO5197193.1 GntR family transcriptional regulator [Anaerolineae bacterium]